MVGLKLVDVKKTYKNGTEAVKNFSIDVADGEFVVLVGPSGCGKTTLLRMVAGLEDISAGEIYIDNRVVNNVPSKDRNIAMVFQSHSLYPHFTVYDNLAFPLRIRREKKEVIAKKVDSVAKMLSVGHLLNRRPAMISGGEGQRVAIGRALIRNPAVFLMDEPLSNLDAKLRTQMRAEIMRLHSELGTIFIYVTHDQIEAMSLGDRIVVMKDGLIQQIGTPEEIYQQPKNVFVATFIGSPQMNILKGCVYCRDGLWSQRIGRTVCRMGGEPFPDSIEYDGIEKDVTVGIRPSDLIIGEECDMTFECRYDYVESLGDYTYVHFQFQEYELTARTVSAEIIRQIKKLNNGDEIPVGFNTGKAYYFDAKTEERLNVDIF